MIVLHEPVIDDDLSLVDRICSHATLIPVTLLIQKIGVEVTAQLTVFKCRCGQFMAHLG